MDVRSFVIYVHFLLLPSSRPVLPRRDVCGSRRRQAHGNDRAGRYDWCRRADLGLDDLAFQENLGTATLSGIQLVLLEPAGE